MVLSLILAIAGAFALGASVVIVVRTRAAARSVHAIADSIPELAARMTHDVDRLGAPPVDDWSSAHAIGPDLASGLYLLDEQLGRLATVIDAEAEWTRRLARAVRALPGGFVVADARGTIVFRNQIAHELAQSHHGDALIEDKMRALIVEAAETGQPGEAELELIGPPRRAVVVSARPVLHDDVVSGALALIQDVTERRLLEEVRRDFVANISHELKTPVGALSLLAETLLDEEDAGVRQRLVERMIQESTRLANTIEDLLVLSRIEFEGLPDTELVTVADVVAEAISRMRPAADLADIEVATVAPDGALRARGDRRQLLSAVANLLDNAVKYSEAGSRVTVRTALDDGWVTIAVVDQGIGIPARDLERIFERFYRVDLARSRQTGGTGLGLSIVRHVMANHDGAVTVESRLGEGSTFTLRLPGTNGRSGPAADRSHHVPARPAGDPTTRGTEADG